MVNVVRFHGVATILPSHLGENITKNEEYILVVISKDEAKVLRNQGFGGYISHTWNKRSARTYYLVEDYKALRALRYYRSSRVISVYQR